ncbi:hypothetical protein DA2_3636 [Desulfovibrio sp. A2]|nr:hypothetical protein DA2_3636 [Desulfovibrio sp. A2]
MGFRAGGRLRGDPAPSGVACPARGMTGDTDPMHTTGNGRAHATALPHGALLPLRGEFW